MNTAEFAINNRLLSGIIIVIIVIAGLLAYKDMPRFEDPEFTIRTAQIITSYPSATPTQVADEVTDRIESAVQQMQEVKEIRSISQDGLSIVEVDIKFDFSPNKSALQIVWSKLRNKVKDAQSSLPSGAQAPLVHDDFGDVYGLYYLLTGEGFSEKELYDYAKRLRKQLLTVKGVANVEIKGQQEEAIYLDISRERAAALGVSLNQIYATLAGQNSVQYSGAMDLGGRRILFQPSGGIDSLDGIRSLVVALRGSNDLITIGDIAEVQREYREPAQFLIRYDGEPALAIGVSNVTGTNVVNMGKAIDKRLAEIASERPLGMELHENYHQGKVVQASVENFLQNVIAALGIVLLTLLIFMGWRSALVIGLVLVLTVLTTLGAMDLFGIPMHRISLGALIIALGMLVDNAIVVTEGILVGVQRGQRSVKAASIVVKQTIWALLGGTIVGILAFAPIGFAEGSTAEFTGDLFWVILLSLSFSWLFAITLVPLFCSLLFHSQPHADKTPAPSKAMQVYAGFMERVLKLRWLLVVVVIGMFVVSVWAFQFVRSGFFPASTTPQVVVDLWMPQGTNIETTNAQLKKLENYIGEQSGVAHVQTLVGGGTLRYMLIYAFENQNPAYGQILVKADSFAAVAPLLPKIQNYVDQQFPAAQAKVWRFAMGPGGGSKIEARFRGPDPRVLRELADQAKQVMLENSKAIFVKDNWRQPIAVMVPKFSPNKAERVGVSREDLSKALAANFDGRIVGAYRENDEQLAIIERPSSVDRALVSNLYTLPVISSGTGESVPITEVVSEFQMQWRDAIQRRFNRVPSIKAQCDPADGVLPSTLEAELKPAIEAIKLPPGYQLDWKGESGNSAEAQESLAATIPLGLAAMVLTVVVLFNALRQPLIIWLIVPLALIGVVIGLLTTGSPMKFMAILGVLSLSGLLIKNAIVLVDQIDLNITEGLSIREAIVSGATSRVRPVMMGTLTTVLGLIPLLGDAFFRAMAVVLIYGLSFATLLTLLVVPALYAIFFGLGHEGHSNEVINN